MGIERSFFFQAEDGIRDLHLDHVDPSRVELAVDQVDLDRVQVVHLDQLDQLGSTQRPGSLAGLEERPDLLDLEEPLDLGHSHSEQIVYPSGRRSETRGGEMASRGVAIRLDITTVTVRKS